MHTLTKPTNWTLANPFSYILFNNPKVSMRHQVKFQASLQNQGLLKQHDLNGLGGILLLKVLKNRAAEILFII